ncbi:MAG: tetratricopeptide repeat protein [Bacteroidota bacterium]
MNARLLAFAIVMAGISSGLAAQTEADKYGTTPEKCREYLSLYNEFYKQNNYTDAMPWWLKSIDICPKASKNLYIHGEKMFTEKIKSETDPKKQSVLLDSLLWVLDKRIEYFGDDIKRPTGEIIGMKGIAIQQFRKEDYAKSYELLKESIKLMGSKSSAAVLLTCMQASRQLFLDGAINEETVLSDYETAMDIVDANLKLTPDDENFKQTKTAIESFFTSSGAANCEALVKLYTGKFEALKDDAEWLKKVTRQLRKAGCTDTDIFTQASEALFTLEPSADAAHNIAYIFMRREDFVKAAEYLEQAVSLGKESEELADMYYELASINFSHFKNYQKAKTLLDKAMDARPNWGKPYLLLGQVFIGARDQMFTEDWDKKTVFWVAVDKFIKAKSIDPEITDEANTYINDYSKYFPNTEEVFFHTLRDGDTYLVKGWINETTRVRSSKL